MRNFIKEIKPQDQLSENLFSAAPSLNHQQNKNDSKIPSPANSSGVSDLTPKAKDKASDTRIMINSNNDHLLESNFYKSSSATDGKEIREKTDNSKTSNSNNENNNKNTKNNKTSQKHNGLDIDNNNEKSHKESDISNTPTNLSPRKSPSAGDASVSAHFYDTSQQHCDISENSRLLHDTKGQSQSYSST